MDDSQFSTLIDDLISLVIDVTYRCNAKCLYCQWGSIETDGRIDQPDSTIFIPELTLKSLGIERIVFSGGEPLIREDLERVISYYSQLKVKSIIVITNGLLLTSSRMNSLINAGLTGITFSLDGISEEVAFNARGFTKEKFNRIFNNLNEILKFKKSKRIEIGLNSVVSRANLNTDEIYRLVQFCNESEIDWIKFNPVFDDGFVTKNASWLMLREEDAPLIRQIGNEIIHNCKIKTNPIEFWDSLASIIEGKKLSGASCGLDKRQAIAIRGKIKFCFWIDNPVYGLTTSPLSPAKVKKIQNIFKCEKKKCKTGLYCFCLQKFDQKWRVTN